MSLTHAVPNRFTALLLGLATTLLLLLITARKGVAEKAKADDCLNQNSSVCRMVETCTPKGFEANGTCNWVYTVSRYYWKY
jgi:hypothetical protein